jgi:hypothetical protein
MNELLHAVLRDWVDFYLITGTAAAALTGLQFVVQTLLAGEGRRVVSGVDPELSIAAFGSPTVVHFALVMILSAVLCAPWPTLGELRTVLMVLAAGALAYSAVVLRRTRRQRGYKPVFEDWLWHIVLPTVSYAMVLVAGLRLGAATIGALFLIAAATLLLLCVGIHNAWDTVTYLTIQMRVAAPESDHASPPRQPSQPHAASRGRRRR